MKIVLASASPRRSELLGQIGLDFEVIVSRVEERVTSSLPGQVVEELSGQKAEAVLEQLCRSEKEKLLVIGADTIVVCDGRILGKPADAGGAKDMLSMLQGRGHEVYTGVTLLLAEEGRLIGRKAFHESTRVFFYPMTDEEIAEYVATGDPLDKAGAYGIQGFCARYISGIEGDYSNVVGLPVGRLYQELKSIGI